MGSKIRRTNSLFTPSKKHSNHSHGDYSVPEQNDVNKNNKERYDIWMEMIKNKRDRSLNRADRNIK